jgi:hypothetical protein
VNPTLTIGTFELPLSAVLLFGLLAASSVLAVHQTAAVYHDGLRTSVPELWKENRSRTDLAKYSYSISIGFIVAYALPYSLATGIVVIHVILLATDILGLRFQRRAVAVGVAFLYGALATVIIRAAAFAVGHIAEYGPALDTLFAPVAYTFPFMAAVAMVNQFGLKWGIASALLTLAMWRLAEAALNGWDSGLSTTSGAVALGVMTVVLVAAAFRGPTMASPGEALYADGVARIKRHWALLVVPPVLIAVAAAEGWLAGEPLQLVLLAVGSPEAAAAVAFFSAVGFVPLIALSSTVSGVWNQDGYPDWYLGAGYLAKEPVVAGAAGLGLLAVELGSLRSLTRLLFTRPGLHGVGSSARDALDAVPAISVLAGSVVAAAELAGAVGAGIVVVVYAFNEAKGRPIMPLAVPVFGFLAVAVAAGALDRLGLN